MCIIYSFCCVFICIYAADYEDNNKIKIVKENILNDNLNASGQFNSLSYINVNDSLDDMMPIVKSTDIEKVITISRKEVNIIFNDSVDAGKAVFQSADFDYPLKSFTQISPTTIYLNFDVELPENGYLTIAYYYLFDKNGESNWGFYTMELDYGPNTGNALFGSVIFTEIMANPKNASGLPDVEYIEIFNRGDIVLNLSGWKYYYNNKPYNLPKLKINPGEYLAFCNSSKNSLFGDVATVYPIESFPVMNNTGKLLYLEDGDGNLIHFVEYSDKWYADKNKSDGGYSLEVVDTDHVYPSSVNWCASNDVSGGTPGRANSVRRDVADSERVYVSSHYINDDNEAFITFSKFLTPLSDSHQFLNCYNADIVNFRYDNYPYCDKMAFDFTYPLFGDDQIYDVELKDIKCLSGNDFYSPGIIRFDKASMVQKGDVLFSEILFNADDPDIKFVELYNNSEKFLNLKDIGLAIPDTNGEFKTVYYLSDNNSLLEPGKYLLISKSPSRIINKYGYNGEPRICLMSKFPALNIKKGRIAIVDKDKNILEYLEYSESLHSTTNKDKTNISIERISFDVTSDVLSNWCSGSESSDFVTPGYAYNADNNTLPVDLSEKTDDKFSLYYPYMTIKDGYPESIFIVRYELEETDNLIDLIVYDSKGIKMCQPYSSAEIMGSGILNVDLSVMANRRVIPGIYIVYIRCKNQNSTFETKLVLPVVP